MVIHVLEMRNPTLVCIREEKCIIGSAVGNLVKGVKENCKKHVYHAWVFRCSPQMKESLTHTIILLEKEETFNHMGKHLETGHLGHELLDMTRWG
jgi:hypothetical protein